MKEIQLERKDINYKDFVKRTATEKDFGILIKEPCILTYKGEIVALYDIVDIDTKYIVDDLKSISYTKGKRTRGLFSQSRIFGYKPRMPIRADDFCGSTSLANENPHVHAKIANLAVEIERYYQKYNPEGYAKHKEVSHGKVKDIWRLNKESVFTSGIINKNNPLKYHFDAGNFNSVYLMMIVFKSGIEGGFLAMPEYNVGFALPNNAIIMFDGQSIMHGVTPITYTVPDAHRFSIVYYSLKQMWKCLTIDEELARIRNVKTQREKLRHNMPQEHKDKLLGRRGKQ